MVLKELVIHSQRKQIMGALQVFVQLHEPDFVLLKVEEPIIVEPNCGISTILVLSLRYYRNRGFKVHLVTV